MPSLSKMRKRYFLMVCSLRPSSRATSRLDRPSATSATTCSSRGVGKLVPQVLTAQRRLEELLTNAMLFVLPREIEGLSLAVLEALAAGLCVLTSDIPEKREFVDGVGFTFRKNDAKDLERMLRLRIADGEVRRSAGRNAKQRIQDGYLWPNIAQQVEQVYLEMMGWKQGPRSG